MHVAAKSKIVNDQPAGETADLSRFVPKEFLNIEDPQTAIPRIAKDAQSIQLIERAVRQITLLGMGRKTLRPLLPDGL